MQISGLCLKGVVKTEQDTAPAGTVPRVAMAAIGVRVAAKIATFP
jgi:hypothetical protein